MRRERLQRVESPLSLGTGAPNVCGGQSGIAATHQGSAAELFVPCSALCWEQCFKIRSAGLNFSSGRKTN